MKTIVTNDDAYLAAEVISAGGLVAVPTETVYGLAANALNSTAVARIYEVKRRPDTKPISVLVTGIKQAEMLCRDIPDEAYKIAEAFFPGPITIILKKSMIVPDIVTAGSDSVGIRCPAQEMTLRIIELAGVPVAAPSANISGKASPKTAEKVLEYFDGKIECVADGGRCAVGVESTIIDMTVRPFKVLRIGGLDLKEIETETGIKIV